jgi:hypothetical protein
MVRSSRPSGSTPDTPADLFPPELEGRKIFLAYLFFVLEAHLLARASGRRSPAA